MKAIVTFAAGLAFAGVLTAAPAQAQAVRTFVSPTGVDSGACSLTAPCRTFAAAYALTDAGGEIAVLGTTGYGTLTISKAISIVNGGGFEAGVSVPSGGIGITINAGSNDAVSLRGLSIEGAGVGQTGITFNSGKSLTVENCVIRHMSVDGIDFFSTTAKRALTVSNSLMADNGGTGVWLLPSDSVTAVFNRIEANNNVNTGIAVNGGNSAVTNTINATVSDSVAADNAFGFVSQTGPGNAPTSFMVSHSVVANNGTGVYADGTGATLRLANSTVTGNTNFGWDVQEGAVVNSYGDNYIDGNHSNTGSLTPIPKQ